MAANSNNLPHPDDMESPRATPDHFRQPTGGATGYEVASRSQSGHSDGGFESKPATIGKPPNKHSPALLDDMTDVKPGIMEMIQEERRVSLFLHNAQLVARSLLPKSFKILILILEVLNAYHSSLFFSIVDKLQP